MDPFNIMIKPGNRQIDLNIHPQEAGSYKVFSDGILIGEINLGNMDEIWEAVSLGDDEILKNDRTVQEIGKQIAISQNKA